MPYPQTDWKDHVLQYPLRVRLVDNGDGTHNIVPEPGEIIQQGTPMSATNFNNMEQGIGNANSMADLLFSYLMLKLGHSDKTLEGLDSELSAAISALETAVTTGTITAKKAETLTAVLGIALGGTGASTAATARTNLAVPSITDLQMAIIYAAAIHSVEQAATRDQDDRLRTAEAQLAALS